MLIRFGPFTEIIAENILPMTEERLRYARALILDAERRIYRDLDEAFGPYIPDLRRKSVAVDITTCKDLFTESIKAAAKEMPGYAPSRHIRFTSQGTDGITIRVPDDVFLNDINNAPAPDGKDGDGVSLTSCPHPVQVGWEAPGRPMDFDAEDEDYENELREKALADFVKYQSSDQYIPDAIAAVTAQRAGHGFPASWQPFHELEEDG